MKKTDGNGNFFRSILAIVIVVLLVLSVSIAVNGWQSDTEGEYSGEDGNSADNADNPNGDTESNDGTADNKFPTTENPEKPTTPEYTYYLTGVECSPECSSALPFVFAMDPSAPLYSISDSELIIEIPTEQGKTRYLVYKSSVDGLGKIGAVAPTRDYISAIVKYFGGVLAARGNDDIVGYSAPPSTLHLDLTKRPDATFKENGKHYYTDSETTESFLEDEGIDRETLKKHKLPFTFAEYGKSVRGNNSAKRVIIPYSQENVTELTYDETSNKYLLSFAGRQKYDLLVGKEVSFTNCFILFTDSITYELAEGTESVLDVASGGYGYYLSGGTMRELRWYTDNSGNLCFRDLSSDELIVNRGNSYIAYFKSAYSDTVIIE